MEKSNQILDAALHRVSPSFERRENPIAVVFRLVERALRCKSALTTASRYLKILILFMRFELSHETTAPQCLRTLLSGLAGVVWVFACSTHPVDAQTALEPVVLQLKWKHQFQFAGYYAALEQGYYREAGLDVRIAEAPDDIEPAEIVLRGDADFGIAASDLVVLRAHGDPVVALAAIYQHSPLILLSLSGRGIDNIHSLSGKKAMIEPHAAELLAYLETEGIDNSALTLLPHIFDPAALVSGEVDVMSAYSTDEPYLLEEAGIPYQIFNPRAGGIDFYGDTLFTTEAQIREHPRRVAVFVDASLRGWQYALEHPEQLVDLVYEHYSQRHSIEHLRFEAEEMRRLIQPEVIEIGYMNPGRWRHIANVYNELAMAPSDLSLKGFLYDRDPDPELFWFYASLFGVMGVLAAISLIAMRFYRLSTFLQQEIAERVRTEESLRTLEKRYRMLVENAPFPIVISSLENNNVLYLNPEAASKLEIDQANAIGTPLVDFYKDPGDLENLLDTLAKLGDQRNYEAELSSVRGVQFWANISANRTAYEDKPAIFFAMTDISNRKELTSRLQTMVMTDELTGLSNRRHFTQRGEDEFRRSVRYGTPLSLLMLDADRFKNINDTFGHEAGDEVLRTIADVLRECSREVDVYGRLGGDEFGVLMPNTALREAINLASRLQFMMDRTMVEVRGDRIRFTLSIGVAEFDETMNNIDDLFRKADVALYADKRRGHDHPAPDGKIEPAEEL